MVVSTHLSKVIVVVNSDVLPCEVQYDLQPFEIAIVCVLGGRAKVEPVFVARHKVRPIPARPSELAYPKLLIDNRIESTCIVKPDISLLKFGD